MKMSAVAGIRLLRQTCLGLLIANCLAFNPTVYTLADEEIRNPSAEVVFQSASKKAEAKLGPHATSLQVFIDGKAAYSTSPTAQNLYKGRALISDDGQTIAWLLDDHISGIIDETMLNAPALICYYKGVMVRSYTLAELLQRSKLVSLSSSHTQWIAEKRDGNWKFSPTVIFSPRGNHLEFETTSMRRYVFNPQTGKMETGEDSEIWKQSEVIVYAQIEGGLGKLHLKNAKFLKGQLDTAAEAVIIDPTGSYDAGWHTIALRKIFGFWTTTVPAYKVSVIYNLLP